MHTLREEVVGMRKGFTLVELLIVLAVIAALMSVATPLALNAVKTAKASQVAQNFRAIRQAFENYWNTERPASPGNVTLDNLKSNGYLSSVPQGFNGTITVSSAGNGVYNVTIEYTADDVDSARVSQMYGEVSNKKLVFQVQKWW